MPRECPNIERAEIGHEGWRIYALDIYPILVVACSVELRGLVWRGVEQVSQCPSVLMRGSMRVASAAVEGL